MNYSANVTTRDHYLVLEADPHKKLSFLLSMSPLQFSNDGTYLSVFEFPLVQPKIKDKETSVWYKEK